MEYLDYDGHPIEVKIDEKGQEEYFLIAKSGERVSFNEPDLLPSKQRMLMNAMIVSKEKFDALVAAQKEE